ncbi:MAG: hypothetical protein ABIV21_00970 [Pyrinomonadaceae bacterium]
MNCTNIARILSAFLLSVLLSTSASGQTPTPSQPGVNEILDKAAAQSLIYIDTFKNLIADETKTFVIYDKNGQEKKRKTVVSNFVVFPLTKEPDRVVEFRNVVSVDGKKIENGDARAQDLFEKISSTDTTEKEIKRLADESLRYDQDILISGMTLFQSVALEPGIRPFFAFELGPSRLVNSRAVYVVDFRQVRDTSEISVNPDSRRSSRTGQDYEIEVDKKVLLYARMNGTLTIDAATFQILAETRRITIQPEGFSEPQIAIEDRFEFQESIFGIYTPKTITHTQYKAKIRDRKMVKEAEVSFAYGNFTRPDIEVKSDDVKAN